MPDTLSLERLFYVSEKLGKLATKRERHHATMQTDIGTPVVPEPIQKEINMFTNRLFNLIVAIALVAVIALTAQAAFSQMNSTYRESKEQAQREYELGERYGEISGYIDGFSPERIQREYVLGERYGETPPHVAQFSTEQLRREYILGERYGVTPQEYAQQQALREYWLGERYGQTP